MDLIHIDGSFGEGGGQILRTSLALSAVTGAPLRVSHIRARRKKPGLMRQHLACVKAAKEICDAEVTGDAIGSTDLRFTPGKVRAGDYHFAVGSAGSCTLVLQTVLPPLLAASGPSRVVVEGGTHNPLAPTFDFLERVFASRVREMGAEVTLRLERYGFYPAGGGRVSAKINGGASLRPVSIEERGDLTSRAAWVTSCALPEHVAEREATLLRDKLGWDAGEVRVEQLAAAFGPGNVVSLFVEHEHAAELVTTFGMKGVKAESVARDAVRAIRRYLASEAPVGEHLADQLLVPMAMSGGGSFVTCAMSRHCQTNAEVISKFLPVHIESERLDSGFRVLVAPSR